jgi:hypothetical protein
MTTMTRSASRRLVAPLAAALALPALCAAPAGAVKSDQYLRVSVKSVQTNGMAKASSRRPANISITLNPGLTFDRTDPPFSTRRAVIFLDRRIAFGGRFLPGCTAPRVLQNLCARDTRVGSGTAKAIAAGLDEFLTVTVYNGRDGRTLLLRVKAERPVPIDEVIVGTLSKTRVPGYGSKLTLVIPQGLQQPAPGAFATLLDFKVTVKGGRASRPLLGVRDCPRAGLRFSGTFSFTDATFQRASRTARCSGR